MVLSDLIAGGKRQDRKMPAGVATAARSIHGQLQEHRIPMPFTRAGREIVTPSALKDAV
jgi:hypothetical protein